MNETTTGAPLTATVGERLGGDPHLEQARKAVAGEGQGTQERKARRRASRRSGGGTEGRARPTRQFPWGALALAVVAWAFATGIGRGIRSRARGIRSRARHIRTTARGMGEGAWRRVRRRA